MLTIGQLAKRYALSRSTLIYYDNKELLKPSTRSGANYRVYSREDIARLERILMFRDAGLSLAVIAEIVDLNDDAIEQALEKRLDTINDEIQALREQQQVVVKLIKNRSVQKMTRFVSKDQWVAMLRGAGLDDEGMKAWHKAFEKNAPEAHQDFLESIGIDADEITHIRAWSK